MKLATTALMIALAICHALAPAGAQQTGIDFKYLSPSTCQPYGLTTNYLTLAIGADGLKNRTTDRNVYVICPVSKDAEGDWIEGQGLDVGLVFRYAGNGTISCTLTIGTDTSLGYPVMTHTQIADRVNETEVLVVSWQQVEGRAVQSASAICRLPPKAKLTSLSTIEALPTDHP